MVHQERQATNWHHQEFHAESVMIRIICSLELDEHEVHSEEGRSNEENLHSSVVGRDEGSE